jgi:4,5-dihydroxyphthalate decarboxylase
MTTATPLEIGLPVMRYDITLPLSQGRVEVEGVKFRPARVSSMISTEDPNLKEGNFGLCDLNIGYLLPAIEAGWQLIGIPVFSKRKPAYQFLFCRTDRGIERPKDLEGKRIGSRSYRTALTVWARGLLCHRYGVKWSKVSWVVQANEVFPIHDREAKIESVDGSKNMVERLLGGEVDALLTDISDVKLFTALERSPKVRRLFPDYMGEDEKLYRETGIFTPVHMIVMSKRLNREHPDLAARLFQAFEQSKKMAYDDILSDLAGFSVVYLRERMKEQMERWGDPWKYGIRANQTTLDVFIQYNLEQGMIRSALSNKDIFAESTLDT